jgi:hypothetical protein
MLEHVAVIHVTARSQTTKDTEAAVTMLADDQAAETVVFGENGLLQAAASSSENFLIASIIESLGDFRTRDRERAKIGDDERRSRFSA